MAVDPSDEEEDDDSQWRFSLSDLESEADTPAAEDGVDGDSADNGESKGNVAGSLDIDKELEAGNIDIENALFVVVGVLLALGFILGFITLLP